MRAQLVVQVELDCRILKDVVVKLRALEVIEEEVVGAQGEIADGFPVLRDEQTLKIEILN